MYAGVKGKGATRPYWATSLELGRLDMCGVEWALGCVDVFKCFDQVVRPLLAHLLYIGGFPVDILSAYMRFHESVAYRNSLCGGLGEAYTKACSIPQGCPWSMLFAAYIMRPWIARVKSFGAFPRVLADDFH
eukprot:15477569-Alexandrium_andersonii.AAC.1